MAWQQPLYLLPLLAAVVISFVVAWVAWRYRQYTGARSLGVLMLAVGWWSLTYLIGIAATELPVKLVAYKLMFPAIAAVPVVWLSFAIEYTGRFRSLARRELGGLLVVPALSVLLVWTNQSHGLVWSSVDLVSRGSVVLLTTSHGPWFWVHLAYSNLLIVAGTGLILQMIVLSDHVYRGQAIALGIAVLVPWGANVIYFTGVTGYWDPTHLGFVISGVVLMAAIFRRQLLQLVPVAREVARDEVFESMVEPVVVVDEHAQVADLNPAAEAIVDRPKGDAIGIPVSDVLPAVAPLADPGSDSVVREEVTLTRDGRERRYEVQAVPLRRGYGTITGQLLTLRDITQRYQREQQVRSQRQRLEVLNRVLRHDIRNGMNVIIGRAGQLTADGSDTDAVVQAIREKSLEMAELSNKARRFAKALRGDDAPAEVIHVVAGIERIIATLETQYPDATFRTDLPDEALVTANGLTTFAIRNVVENAVEHNDDPQPTVAVSVRAGDEPGEPVRIEVADDGPGLPSSERAVIEEGRETQLEHSDGLGLWLANWVVTDSGGDVEIASNEPRGTIFTIRLPGVDVDGDQPKPADSVRG